MLDVGCRGGVVEGGGRLVGRSKMHSIRIDLITDLFWVKIETEK